MGKNAPVWAMVAVFVSGLAAIVTILTVVPDSNALGGAAVTAILGFLGSALTGTWVASRVNNVATDVNNVATSVAEVHDKVNGRMSQLIDKLPPADRPAEESGGSA